VVSSTETAAGSAAGLNTAFLGLHVQAAGEVENVIGYDYGLFGAPTTTPDTINVFAFSQQGSQVNSNYRASENYRFLFCNDPAMDSDIGSLRKYQERFGSAQVSSGTLTVAPISGDGQVQYVPLFEDVTNITCDQFETVQPNAGVFGVKESTDTVTLICHARDASRTITLPAVDTNGDAIKYAGGVNSITLAQNSVCMISVTGIAALPGISGDNMYLVSMSPEFE
jgi:hypothetical protein